MDAPLIPRNFQEWHHCITVLCQQPLTASYIEQRIAALNSPKDHTTAKFVELYGEAQRQKTLGWFQRAQKEL